MSERGQCEEYRDDTIEGGVTDGAVDDRRHDWRFRIELRIEERVGEVTR